ncbi:MAG: ABC transporter permease subunit, partial [Planctomycetaceae bacterium]
MFRILTTEILRTLALALAILLSMGLMAKVLLPQQQIGLLDFLSRIHLGADNRPIAAVFLTLAADTTMVVFLAVAILTVISLVLGALQAGNRRLTALQPMLAAVSCLPSFLWPVLIWSVIRGPKFVGVPTDVSVIWPALALAFGDLNLVSLTSVTTDLFVRERSSPHARLLTALGRNTWFTALPRVMVGLLAAVGARIPHLMGGTIAVEILFHRPGLGVAVQHAIFDPRPDPALLYWACGYGLIVSRFFFLLNSVGTWILMPHLRTRQRKVRALHDNADSADKLPLPADSGSATETTIRKETPESQLPANPEQTYYVLPKPAVRSGRNRLISRALTFIRMDRLNYVHTLWILSAAATVVVLFTWGLCRTPNPIPATGMQLPGPNYILGTNKLGNGVLYTLQTGFRQQIGPLVAALLLIVVVVVPASCLSVITKTVDRGVPAFIMRSLIWIIDALTELIDSIPKLIIILAAVSYFDDDSIVWKMFAVTGMLFTTHLYRSLRSELAVLNNETFIETTRMLRVSVWTILKRHVLVNHTLQVVLIQ